MKAIYLATDTAEACGLVIAIDYLERQAAATPEARKEYLRMRDALIRMRNDFLKSWESQEPTDDAT